MTDFSDVDGVIRTGHRYTLTRLEALAQDDEFTQKMRSAGIAFPDPFAAATHGSV